MDNEKEPRIIPPAGLAYHPSAWFSLSCRHSAAVTVVAMLHHALFLVVLGCTLLPHRVLVNR